MFGVSSDECLNYAVQNRLEWEQRGKQVVESLVKTANEKFPKSDFGTKKNDMEDDIEIAYKEAEKARRSASVKTYLGKQSTPSKENTSIKQQTKTKKKKIEPKYDGGFVPKEVKRSLKGGGNEEKTDSSESEYSG